MINMGIKGVQQVLECGDLGYFVAGLLTIEKESYERRVQNLVFFASRNYRIPNVDFGSLEFEMSVDGPFSEQVRICLKEIADNPEVTVKVDMAGGNPQTRYISNFDTDIFGPELWEVIRSVRLDTEELSTDELVMKNIREGDEDLPDSNQSWIDSTRDIF